MRGLLAVFGWMVLLLGLGGAAVAAGFWAGDARFAEIAASYAKHPDHPLFQLEYATASVRHYSLLLAAIASLVVGLSVGTVALGLSEVLRRLPADTES